MSVAQRVRPRTKVLFTGDLARAIYNALSLMARFTPPIDRIHLLLLVPGVFSIWYDYGNIFINGYTSDEAIVWYDSKSKRLLAITALPVSTLRWMIGWLLHVFYNYLVVLGAHYGRAEWATYADNILHLTTVDGVNEDFATVLRDLAFLDEYLVKTITYVLSNTHVRVKLPPGVVDKKELRKLAGENRFYVYKVGRVGDYDVTAYYNPYYYRLSISFYRFNEKLNDFVEALEFDVVVHEDGNVIFSTKVVSGNLSDFRWVVENRCSIVKHVVEEIEKRVAGDEQLQKNLALFRRAVEAACKLSAKGF
ncbi:MAG: hypothetical protein QXE66_04225 [Desulfurococcaceae archaeon]